MKKIIAKVKSFIGPKEEPEWFKIALTQKGVKEVFGQVDNPKIIEYHSATALKATDDETPWCSSFVNWVMMKAGYERTYSAAARSWLSYGDSLKKFKPYCIVVLKRGKHPWQGHVAFAVEIAGGKVLCLGGNQSNQVCYQWYSVSDVLGYRWPNKKI